MTENDKSVRLDVAEIDTKFTMTSEGYLQGYAIVSNIGVFSYRKLDGTIQKEARKPEEVFHLDAIQSALGKPITNNHPTKLLNPDNVKEHVIGAIGNDYKADGIHLSLPITIWDRAAIKAIKSGKQGLSLGYKSRDIPNTKKDVFLGMDYDVEQTEIRINHLSLVDKGRAGSAAKIRLDGAQAPIEIENSVVEDNMAEATLKVINLDSVDYQAEPEVIQAYQVAKKDSEDSKASAKEVQEKFDSLTADKTKIEAERDQLKVKLDGVQKELDEAKASKLDKADIRKAAKELVELEGIAKQFNVEVKEDMDDLSIMKEVILSTDKEAKLDDETYVKARFDCIVADAKKSVKEDESVRSVGSTAVKGQSPEKATLATARAAYNERLQNAHKTPVQGKE